MMEFYRNKGSFGVLDFIFDTGIRRSLSLFFFFFLWEKSKKVRQASTIGTLGKLHDLNVI